MIGTIDHMRSTHEVSPVMSDGIHAHAHATAARVTVKASGDMERPYREISRASRTLTTSLAPLRPS